MNQNGWSQSAKGQDTSGKAVLVNLPHAMYYGESTSAALAIANALQAAISSKVWTKPIVLAVQAALGTESLEEFIPASRTYDCGPNFTVASFASRKSPHRCFGKLKKLGYLGDSHNLGARIGPSAGRDGIVHSGGSRTAPARNDVFELRASERISAS
jgi:hypothetical protein